MLDLKQPIRTKGISNGWRSILKNKGYSFINVGGPAVAMLIALWGYDEFDFNDNKNHSRHRPRDEHLTLNGEPSSRASSPDGLGVELSAKYGDSFKRVAWRGKLATKEYLAMAWSLDHIDRTCST